jgi:hypothetical protein
VKVHSLSNVAKDNGQDSGGAKRIQDDLRIPLPIVSDEGVSSQPTQRRRQDLRFWKDERNSEGQWNPLFSAPINSLRTNRAWKSLHRLTSLTMLSGDR